MKFTWSLRPCPKTTLSSRVPSVDGIDRVLHDLLQACAAALGADREAEVAQARAEIRALDVEVDVRDRVGEWDERMLRVVPRADQAVLFAVPERER